MTPEMRWTCLYYRRAKTPQRGWKCDRDPAGHTLNFTPSVYGDESVWSFWWLGTGLRGWVKETQHGCSKLKANLLGVEVAVCQFIPIVSPGELCQRTCSPDADIIGVEFGINHKSSIKNKASIIDGLKGFIIHCPVGKAKKCLKRDVNKWRLLYIT